jgi:two-component system, OmpR family, alkaline phosphatase synthesis response regulator PhoP
MARRRRILIVEDNRRTSSIVERYLRGAGYEVTIARDGPSGVAQCQALDPDLVILDVMLPGCDGFDVCRQLRDVSETPVVMLTARIDEADRLRGLFGGADDYVVKPFSPRELVARVHTILRRAAQPDQRPPVKVDYGAMKLDPLACDARIAGVSLELTLTEFRLLEALCSSPGMAWSRERLLERAFGWDYEGSERTVDTHIANLRKKLALSAGAPSIQTVFGRGYRIVIESPLS